MKILENKWFGLFLVLALIVTSPVSMARVESTAKSKKASIVMLYTVHASDDAEQFDNLNEVAQFSIDQYDLENKTKSDFKLFTVDDKDNPQHAQKVLKKIVEDEKPIAIVGPLYSNVALGLKDFINESQIPMVSIFATHNDLTKNSAFMFRICASNRRLVKSMADYLIPEVQKHGLSVTTFKDVSDDYSTDLADTFRINISGAKINTNEILFRGLSGIERLKDINAKLWRPTKKDVLFLPTRDIVAGKIITAMESEPYMVAAIDTVNFLGLMKKIKSQKTHIKLVTTSQWLPGKSEFSKKIEAAYQKRFRKAMNITSALTFDATYAVVAAHYRAQSKTVPLAVALRDASKVTGVTGLILIGQDGERVFSDQFLKEEFIE
ncbi:MAG: ABC transporter substrate-binding protein [Oligoflexia bacterium]|nr:ABC transporter substrate-binding protein [Oligoflexia bacterium]